MLKNIKKILVVAGILSSLAISTAYAGVPVQQVQTVAQEQARQGAWEQQADSTWKYSLNGVYLTNAWVESATEPGAWYFLNENGIMLTSSYTVDGYFVDTQGVYRAGHTETVYTEEEETEHREAQHREAQKEAETTATDTAIDEGLALINEAIANGERIPTYGVGLH